jgi:hypothetical protein
MSRTATDSSHTDPYSTGRIIDGRLTTDQFAADQLGGTTPWAAQLPVPIPALRSPRNSRRGAALVGAVAAVAAGVVGFLQLRDDSPSTAGADSKTSTTVVQGVAGNTALTTAELSNAYVAVFGVQGDSTTLSCIGSQLGSEGGEAARLANGELLTFEEASAAFMPFVTCAPDADFNAGVVPTVMQLFAQQADATCIEASASALGTTDRAAALALAITDPNAFAQQLGDYFAPCSY